MLMAANVGRYSRDSTCAVFSCCSPVMADLTPATPDDLREALVWALRRNRGKPTRQYDDLLAGAAAEHLMEELRRMGFVVMRRPPLPGHSMNSSPYAAPVPPGESGP